MTHICGACDILTIDTHKDSYKVRDLDAHIVLFLGLLFIRFLKLYQLYLHVVIQKMLMLYLDGCFGM